jgi:hypothetical protein
MHGLDSFETMICMAIPTKAPLLPFPGGTLAQPNRAVFPSIIKIS